MKKIATRKNAAPEEMKKYIFIIDEINRGEISKIFGELFSLLIPDIVAELERFRRSMQISMLTRMRNFLFRRMFILLAQ